MPTATQQGVEDATPERCSSWLIGKSVAHWFSMNQGALSFLSKPITSQDTLSGPCSAAPSLLPTLQHNTTHFSSVADPALGDLAS